MVDEFTTQLFVLTVLGSFAIGVVISAALVYRDSELHEAHRKRRLLQALRETRLAGVLERSGVAPSRHVEKTPAGTLRREIRRCRQCRHQSRCYVALQAHRSQLPLAECPNRSVFWARQTRAATPPGQATHAL